MTYFVARVWTWVRRLELGLARSGMSKDGDRCWWLLPQRVLMLKPRRVVSRIRVSYCISPISVLIAFLEDDKRHEHLMH
ncbi:hypothetical protein CC86DRAFT_71977 [Ophiobolus disseminans]|uniref:Uncharacterized protein n=1 Tax=Ophiobolus disseminans TaxID=1469910 RepID=A0A6A6ZPN5_9PLEO|nr:hypothetical protein CC86DRAFT_71977 [Ophiobolus disseminans]